MSLERWRLEGDERGMSCDFLGPFSEVRPVSTSGHLVGVDRCTLLHVECDQPEQVACDEDSGLEDLVGLAHKVYCLIFFEASKC